MFIGGIHKKEAVFMVIELPVEQMHGKMHQVLMLDLRRFQPKVMQRFVFIVTIRSVYKELHADRETGC